MVFNGGNGMNPMQLMQMIQKGGNPQQLVMGLLESSAGNNPVMSNLLNLAKSGKTNDIEQVARNLLKEQGRDFDKEFANFKQSLGL